MGEQVRQVVLATHNAHKVEEFRGIVARILPDITVVGYDMGEQTATQLLDENSPLYCTLEQDMYTMGYKAVEQLVKTLRGEETECPRGDTVYLEGIIHSKEDLPEVQTWLDGYYKLANS